MKNIRKVLSLCLCIASLYAHAQVICSGTTQEEYNYVTKGYRIQRESGLDMKKGYSLKLLIDRKSTNSWRTQILGLYRIDEKCNFVTTKSDSIQTKNIESPCAIMIWMIDNEGTSQYFCLPRNNSSKEIWNRYFGDSDKWQETLGWAQGMAWALALSTSYFAQNN